MRILSAVALLALMNAACVMSALQATPTPSPQPAPTATPTETLLPPPTLPWGHAVQTSAYVLPYALNIHGRMVNGTPGPLLNKYLYTGDNVIVLLCLGDWCDIEVEIAGEEVEGSVFRGCLSNVAESLMCREAE